ncbi:hypothetical protein NQ314_014402 [Rhamnusium bicolor]|uniref:Uncharacterized protein n=1 Tax=Rhamnusium bicolor TaxID=1586634 RepID=A0AAV8X1H6_9CUCU|nr:hypothetical protein NQ314_014402 [Rhamnusium bicolor]
MFRNRVILERRRIRDATNPFELPEEMFKNFFRFSREMATEIINMLSSHLRYTRRSTAIAKELHL